MASNERPARLTLGQLRELGDAMGYLYEAGGLPPGSPQWMVEYTAGDGGLLNLLGELTAATRELESLHCGPQSSRYPYGVYDAVERLEIPEHAVIRNARGWTGEVGIGPKDTPVVYWCSNEYGGDLVDVELPVLVLWVPEEVR